MEFQDREVSKISLVIIIRWRHESQHFQFFFIPKRFIRNRHFIPSGKDVCMRIYLGDLPFWVWNVRNEFVTYIFLHQYLLNVDKHKFWQFWGLFFSFYFRNMPRCYGNQIPSPSVHTRHSKRFNTNKTEITMWHSTEHYWQLFGSSFRKWKLSKPKLVFYRIFHMRESSHTMEVTKMTFIFIYLWSTCLR